MGGGREGLIGQLKVSVGLFVYQCRNTLVQLMHRIDGKPNNLFGNLTDREGNKNVHSWKRNFYRQTSEGAKSQWSIDWFTFTFGRRSLAFYILPQAFINSSFLSTNGRKGNKTWQKTSGMVND